MIYHWISKDNFATCLIGSKNGFITLAPPILKWIIGKDAKEILLALKSNEYIGSYKNNWRGCTIASFSLIHEHLSYNG